MTNQAKQIVSMFEVCGMTPEQIAADTNLDLLSVKSCLASYSEQYNEQQDEDGVTKTPEDVTDEEFAQVKAIYKSLLFSDDDKVKERAARFLWNEKKGRNNEKAVFAQVGKMNILMFNDRLIKAREAKMRLMVSSNSQPKTIDVEVAA